VEIALKKAIDGRERRRAVRHAVNTPAYASLSGSFQAAGLELWEILNISESGTCIQAPQAIEANRLVPLVLDLSETGARIETFGQVVWTEDSGKAGIRFRDASEAVLFELRRWFAANDLVESPTNSRVASRTDSRPAFLPPTEESRSASAAGYSSLLVEWAEIEREVELLGPNLEAALELIAQRAVVLTWATSAAIALPGNGHPSELICEARAGKDSPPRGSRLNARSGFIGECLRSRAAVKSDDTDLDPRVARESRGLGVRSLIVCPIKTRKDEMLGVFEVFSPEPAAFWDNDVRTLERLARIAANAVGRSTGFRPLLPANDYEQGKMSDAAAQATTSLEQDPAAADLSPTRQALVLFLSGIAAVVLAVWYSAPWIMDATNQPVSTPKPQAVETRPASDYLGMAMVDLKKAAMAGDPAAQYSLGMRYESGDGIGEDDQEALRWFLKAAQNGDVRAPARIATCFLEGKGAARDYSKAYFWGLLAQAAGDESGDKTVTASARHLTPRQRSSEQLEADEWLVSSPLGSSSRAPR
jgi:putative methionine-R-sulfoxide reductase with GAF domain